MSCHANKWMPAHHCILKSMYGGMMLIITIAMHATIQLRYFERYPLVQRRPSIHRTHTHTNWGNTCVFISPQSWETISSFVHVAWGMQNSSDVRTWGMRDVRHVVHYESASSSKCECPMRCSDLCVRDIAPLLKSVVGRLDVLFQPLGWDQSSTYMCIDQYAWNLHAKLVVSVDCVLIDMYTRHDSYPMG